MISIDPRSSSPIFEQLVKQLRYLIAKGHFDPRKNLPSTRALADTLGISFHTVRKAYQQLEAQGLLRATVGSGYRIENPAPLSPSDRIERGAEILAESLQQLVGLGLTDAEIEYLVDEQLGLLETGSTSREIIFVSPSPEIAETCAEALSRFLQRNVDGRSLAELSDRSDADYVLAEFRNVAGVRVRLPHADVIGISTHLSPEALDRFSRLLPSETLGLLTRDAESIRYLSDRIKRDSGFGGQIVATAVASEDTDLSEFFRGVDLLGFTAATSRRINRITQHKITSVQVAVIPDADSLQSVADALP